MGSPQCQFIKNKQKLLYSKSSTKKCIVQLLGKSRYSYNWSLPVPVVYYQQNVQFPLIFFIKKQPCAEPKQFVTISWRNGQRKQSFIIPNLYFSNMHSECFFKICYFFITIICLLLPMACIKRMLNNGFLGNVLNYYYFLYL